jgi:N-acetyl-alpha-D-muramate 1-phosphate uridylyltransferase
MQRFPVMLFAAGFGTRMGELTRDRPKPLIEVAGRSLLDHALDVTERAGLDRRVINLHYQGDRIERHLAGQNIACSWEREEILDTGGGLRAALPLLDGNPVFTLNTDAVWSGQNALVELGDAWDEDRMDALLLLAPVALAEGHRGRGDFVMDAEGRITRADGREGLVYLGAQIIRTEQLADFPERAFSLNRLWDRMIAAGRAYGVIHDGGWCDVGRPEGIVTAEAMLARSGNE